MSRSSIPGLNAFLRDYPLMSVRPSPGESLLLQGRFAFTANSEKHGQVTDSYALSIDVPRAFPKTLPHITETEQKIPRTGDFHVNPDGTLCLGSPLRLLVKLGGDPTLTGFTDKCLVPYLFAISLKLQNGGPLAFDELAHGIPGMLADYMDLFGLKEPEQARAAFRLLGIKKRQANKLPCPCACGFRVGRCKLNQRLSRFRNLASRSWFRAQQL